MSDLWASEYLWASGYLSLAFLNVILSPTAADGLDFDPSAAIFVVDFLASLLDLGQVERGVR